MSFNEGFSATGIPYVTGSIPNQSLVWDDVTKSWVPGQADSGISEITSSGNITGSGTSGNPVTLKDNISLTSITASNIHVLNHLHVAGTASVAHLETINQSSLIVGDKYITIMSGSNNHTDLDGAGILYGSGSTDGTTGDEGSVAYLLYRGVGTDTDYLEVFPGLKVSGSFVVTHSGSISGSLTVLGDINGTASVAKDAEKLDGLDSIEYAKLNKYNQTQNWFGNQLFDTPTFPGAATSSLYVQGGGDIVVQNAAATKKSRITSDYFSGSGQYVYDLTGSNWAGISPANRINNFYSDVRQAISGGANITFNRSTGVITGLSFQGVTTASVNSNLSGVGTQADPISVVGDPTFNTVTASTGFSGSLLGTASYAINSTNSSTSSLSLNSNLLQNNPASYFARTGSNTFTGKQTVNADLQVNNPYAITGTLRGNIYGGVYDAPAVNAVNITATGVISGSGANITNLTGSNWANGGVAGFNDDIYNRLSSSNGVTINKSGNKTVISWDSQLAQYTLASTGSITGSGAPGNEFTLKDSIRVTNDVTASNFLGDLVGTASHLYDNAGINGYVADDFAILNELTNSFLGQVTADSIIVGPLDAGDVTANSYTATNGFFGDGSSLTNLSASNWGPDNSYINDLYNSLTGSNGIEIYPGVTVPKIEIKWNQAGVTNLGLESTGSITGSGTTDNRFDLKPSINVTNSITSSFITASSGFYGRLYGTASYAENSGKLNNLQSTDFARVNFNNLVGITGSFSGSFFGVSTGTSSFSNNSALLDGTGSYQFATTSSNFFYGDQEIEGYVSSSVGFTGSFLGNIDGTSSYASNSSLLDGYSKDQFATTSSNFFYGGQNVDGYISSSVGFVGDGSNIINLSGSNWGTYPNDFASDVRNQLSGSGGVEYDSSTGIIALVGGGFGTLNISTNLTGTGGAVALDLANSINVVDAVTASYFTGDGSNLINLTASSFSTWYQDVRDVFIAGDGISITQIGNQYQITSSGGSGGSGISSVLTTGSITGSGVLNDEIKLKNDIAVVSLSASSRIETISVTSSYISSSQNIQTNALTASNVTTNNINSNYITSSFLTASNINNYFTTYNPVDPTVFNTNTFYFSNTSSSLKYNTDISPITLNIGQQVVVRAKNVSPSNITKGKIIEIKSYDLYNLTFDTLASYDLQEPDKKTYGMVMNDVLTNEYTYILLQGVLTGITANKFGQGFDAINPTMYLSSSGDITSSVPPDNTKYTVKLGKVLRAGNGNETGNATIYFDPQVGTHLDYLHDVKIENKQNGDLVSWNSSLGEWINTKTLNGNYDINGQLTASHIRSEGDLYVGGTVNAGLINGVVTYALTCSAIAGNAPSDLAYVTQPNTFLSGNIFQKDIEVQADITGSGLFIQNNLRVNGTASIAHLETIEQSSLVVGDKYIVIMSGGVDHVGLDGAGLLWGTASSGPSIDDNGAHAYIKFSNSNNNLEIWPGLRVSGSLTSSGDVYVPAITASSGFSGDGRYLTNLTSSNINNFSIDTRALFTGSVNITVTNGTSSLVDNLSITSITASSGFSGSFYGDGAGLKNISSQNSTIEYTGLSGGDSLSVGDLVCISGSGGNYSLYKANNNNDTKSNFIGVVKTADNINGNYEIITAGKAVVLDATNYNPGTLVYVGANGACCNYSTIPSSNYITQVGIVSLDNNEVVLQPRIYGQKS